MPQAREKPGHQGGEVHGESHTDGLTQVGAAPFGEPLHGLADGQGVEHVIRKPGAHGDVPAVPVFGGGFRGEGAVEVLGEPQPQHTGEADGDVNAPREVAVDDGGVEDDEEQDVHAAEVLGSPHDGLDRAHEGVGHHHLLEKAPQHPQKARR